MPLDDRWISRRSLIGSVLASGGLAGCSAVGAFNSVVPVDPGTRRVASDIAYGPDPRHRLDVYAPAVVRPRSPVVQFNYGGSWNSGSKDDYAFVGHALASRGVVVVVMDYRLVPQVRFPGFVEDLALARRWIEGGIAPYGGDPRRVVVMGHSAGAYNAAMVSLDPSFGRAAGLRGKPFAGFVGLAGPYDFLPLDVSATREAFGNWPDLARTQPVTVAASGSPPSFLAHGKADTTVYPRNTARLASVLRARRVPVTERYYEDTSHAGIVVALAKPFRDKAPVLDDVMAFLASIT